MELLSRYQELLENTRSVLHRLMSQRVLHGPKAITAMPKMTVSTSYALIAEMEH